MYNPPRPGEIIKGLTLDPMGASITDAATAMGINRKTLSKVINGRGRVTPEIAVRLSIALGGSPESWLGHQMTQATLRVADKLASKGKVRINIYLDYST